MKIIRRVVVFDATDIDAESAFWAGLLGGTVHRDDDWHSIVVDGEWVMGPRAPADNPDGTERFAVYASPAGHPLCFGTH
jgi:hypothetical protein